MNSKQDSILRGFRCTQYLAHEERCRLLYGPYEPPMDKRGFLVAAKSGLAALPTRQYRGRNSKIKAKAEAAALFYAGT
jgi:hypothetical protein